MTTTFNRRRGDSISIVIPVLNEEGILEASLTKLHDFLVAKGVDHEVLVVSNGSTDRTEAIGAALAARWPWLRFFALPEKSVGKAFACGVRHARHESLVALDADLSSDLGYVLDARALLRQSAAVVGCKSLGEERRGLLRVMGSQIYILFSQLVLGLGLLDYSMGCKAYRRSLILPVLDHIDGWTGYTLELCLYLHVQGARILQVGVRCDDTRKSRFNLLHEGLYRYAHLYRCWRRVAAADSWFRRIPLAAPVPDALAESEGLARNAAPGR